MAKQSNHSSKNQLSPEAYAVCRQGATESPFSGKWLHHKASGWYHCVCCDAKLFTSTAKFDSGCGWPSFDRSETGAIKYLADHSHGMQRVEVRCAACDAHLGHVFPDGPTESGQRYCINSVALDFDAKG